MNRPPATMLLHGSLCLAVITLAGCGSRTGDLYAPDAGQATAPHDARAEAHLDAPDAAPVEAQVPDTMVARDSGPDGVVDATPDAAFPDDVAETDAGPTPALVYGQSGTTLYSVDPTTKALRAIGDFSGCGGAVLDIALDSASKMYATTFTSVYTVNTQTAACHRIAFGGSYPNSLSFVPAGTADPHDEALVGYDGGEYVRIDVSTGAVTTIGSLGDTAYRSSGDLVSVIGGATYLTVTGGSDCAAHDCLVEVNPKTGALVMNYGSVDHSAVYGLAYWGNEVYGFDGAGDLFQVDFPSPGGLTITTIAIPDAPRGLSFYGAGSSTAAARN